MKYNFLLILFCLALVACGQQKEADNAESKDKKEIPVAAKNSEASKFGELIEPEGAISPKQLLELTTEGNDSLQVKFESEIFEVCQKKGCWMTVQFGETDMMVRFKDYGFFVPTDAAGKMAIMEGVAFRDTVSVEDLKHYAKDAGKSEEYIASITEPELTWAFEATGVIIKEE